VADLLERNRRRIATVETLDTGKTWTESGIDVDDVAASSATTRRWRPATPDGWSTPELEPW
jgi:acyl-CoA reductase-like NAD-dependent aldehyde dehydrogenase